MVAGHFSFFFSDVPAICAWAWFQTSCGFISLNAWFWEIQNPQYAVDATAGVYRFVSTSNYLISLIIHSPSGSFSK
jgi:hypothetical protein